MRSVTIAIVFLFVVFVIAVAIMFAIALGIIIAYEYMAKRGVKGGGKNSTSGSDVTGSGDNGWNVRNDESEDRRS